MKKALASLFVSTMVAMPALASAATLDQQTLLSQLLAQLSALTAEQPISCTIFTSATFVKAGQPLTFAWYSTGENTQAQHNGTAFAPYGVQTLVISTPGIWKYTMDFYDAAGAEYSCTAKITVSK